jgi:hypothetical protein
MVYYKNGRKDWDYYSTVSVELLKNEANDSWTDNPKLDRLRTSWEDGLAGHLDFIDLLNKLNDRNREILYLTMFEGYKPKDIGVYYGFTRGSISSQGARLIDTAVGQAAILINPYEGECKSGHERTPTSVKVVHRKDGVYVRSCLICQKANSYKAHAAIKAKKNES